MLETFSSFVKFSLFYDQLRPSSFFPSQIQPFFAIISNTIFNLLVKVKICKPPQKRYNVAGMGQGGSGSQSHITITLPLMNPSASSLADNTDAERRR